MGATADTTLQDTTIVQGGFPSLGPRIGMIQSTINIPIGYEAASSIKVFDLPAKCAVLAAGFEIVTASTAGLTAALSNANSGATYLAQTAADAAVGTNVMGASSLYPQQTSAASAMYLVTAAATQALAGSVRVWAVIADLTDQKAFTAAPL